jgi:nucleoside-diphosphate-sugar epimerase
MPDRKKALIAGATGVVGRNLLRHLLTLDDWDVIAVCRRKPDVEGRYEHVAVDLLDRPQTFDALKRPRGVTHVFFSAYIERPTLAEMVAPNQTMLVNLMESQGHRSRRRHPHAETGQVKGLKDFPPE